MKTHPLIERYLPGRAHATSGETLVVPVTADEVRDTLRALFKAELPLIVMFASQQAASRTFRIHYVFGVPREHAFIVPTLELAGTETFPSLAEAFPVLALYEREIMTMFGLTAEGHPDPRSLVLHEENWPAHTYPLRKDFAWDTRLPEKESGSYRFTTVEGEGIYEIPVGPVHAGIIEPGHFRFSVAGEKIVALEARLGWVHKGVEKLFETLPLERHTELAERISGDSSCSHSLAYCEAFESLSGSDVSARARCLRLIFAEIERLTMHIFDIGNIAGNGTGFSFMVAHGFRMAEELRILSERLSGSRFLRGINIPGGVTVDVGEEAAQTLRGSLAALKVDFTEMMRIADASASLMNRLKDTGTLLLGAARTYGALGPAARAVSIPKDVRIDRPYAAYGDITPSIVLESAGDVEARFRVRVREVFESFSLIERALGALPSGAIWKEPRALPSEGIAVSTVEGWRGEIAYALIAEKGTLARVKVRDASFVNWQLFPHVISLDMVPDFPLINKSFNLSYTGNDL